jgi:hypothetical protein
MGTMRSIRRRSSASPPATTVALLSILLVACDWLQRFHPVAGWAVITAAPKPRCPAARCRTSITAVRTRRTNDRRHYLSPLADAKWRYLEDDGEKDFGIEQCGEDINNDHKNGSSSGSRVGRSGVDRRRIVVVGGVVTAATLWAVPAPSRAGELGAKITAAVTQSELGQSVRRSVVQGAQVMDQLDQTVERFSDRFQLGAERSQRPGRPPPKVIPPPRPLDVNMATEVLALQDRIFCSEAKMDANVLQAQVAAVDQKARPAFARSGSELSATGALSLAADFNYLSYIHYKAYLDLIVGNNVPNFPLFKQNFDRKLAAALFALTKVPLPPLPLARKDGEQERIKALNGARDCLDQVLLLLMDKGFIATFDSASVEPEAVADWAADLTDLTWSVAIDGDITLQSQCLLQDQGFRLYPNMAHLLVEHVLQNYLIGQKVEVENYYMDTDYNTDPAKFEVKELLINVRIDSA